MMETEKASRNWGCIFGSILLAIAILISGRVALARDSQQVNGPLNGRVYKNLFEYRMCLANDSNWCPNGDDFQATLFDEMYADPALGADPAYFWDDEGVMVPHYPTSTVGVLTRYSVDFCENGEPNLEDGTCPDVYDFDVVRCLDGTRPVFYYKPGTGAGANKWLFNIQSGGVECSDGCPISSILPGNRKDFSSAYNENATTGIGTGIYSENPDNLFKDYNVVMLDKCVGDRNLGDTTYTDVFTGALGIEPGTGPVYFHGYRVILATLRHLEREFDLADAEQIVFLTHSNGTNGAYHYIDRLSDHISTTLGITASVRLVASSYVLPGPEVEFFFEEGYWPANYTDIPDSITVDPGIINAPNTPPTNACGPGFDRADPYYSHWIIEGRNANGGKTCDGIDPDNGGANGKAYATEDFQSGREADNFAVWGGDNGVTVTWDQSCVDAHASDPDLRACRDSRHIFTHHLQTPTFFSAQLADRNLRTVNPALSTWSPESKVWWPEDMKLRVEKLAEVISGYETRSACADDDLGAHGFFIDNTVEHMAVTVPSKVARQMKANTGPDAGANFQFQEYLMYWLQPSAPTVQCLDSNPIYDAEFMPPYIEPLQPLISYPVNEWPANVRCQTGYYPGGSQPYQSCDDPGFGDPTNPVLNLADSRWICQAPPALDKSVSPSSAKPGEAITYTISFINASAITATNVLITDTLSAYITNPNWSSSIPLTPIAGQTYAWSAPDLVQGEGVVITITGVLTKPLAAGTLLNTVALSISGTVRTVDVSLMVENVAPVANAGTDQDAGIGQVVTLDGSGTDDNGDTLTYAWTQTGGSPEVILSDPSAQNPTFTAPSTATVLTFTLTVTDIGKLTDTDEVEVAVTGLQQFWYFLPVLFKP